MTENEPEDGDEDDEVESIDVNRILEAATDDDALYRLPPHQRCAAHTMNLVANDAGKASTEGTFNRASRAAMSKCQALWNKQRRSSTSADAIKSACENRLFVVPCVTRSNSMFYALQRVHDIIVKSPDGLDDLMDTLGLPRFIQQDKVFITEYITVMKPVA